MIPCKDCIVFALCNARVHQLNGVYKTHYIIQRLENRCNLLSSWVHIGAKNMFEVTDLRKKLFCRAFKIKLNDTPDYNLLRHIDSKRGDKIKYDTQ
jgi:hypothetical protein